MTLNPSLEAYHVPQHVEIVPTNSVSSLVVVNPSSGASPSSLLVPTRSCASQVHGVPLMAYFLSSLWRSQRLAEARCLLSRFATNYADGLQLVFKNVSIILPSRFGHFGFPWLSRFLRLMKLYRIVDVTQDIANTILFLDIQFQK
jgi:hypothetical protein